MKHVNSVVRHHSRSTIPARLHRWFSRIFSVAFYSILSPSSMPSKAVFGSLSPKIWTDLIKERIEILLEGSIDLDTRSSTGCGRIKKRKKLIQMPIIRMVCKYAEFHTLRFCNPNWLSHVMSSRDYIIPFGSRCSWKLWVIKMNHIVLTSKQTVDFWYTISACHSLSSSRIWASKLVFYLYPGVLRLYPTIFHLRYDHTNGKGLNVIMNHPGKVWQPFRLVWTWLNIT